MDEDLQKRIKDIALTYKWVSSDCKEEPVIADDELYGSLLLKAHSLRPSGR